LPGRDADPPGDGRRAFPGLGLELPAPRVRGLGRGFGAKAAGNAARARPPLACRQSLRYILNHMVQSSGARLDASFAALSDATRRGVLEQLGRADASITVLAEKFHMTLTGMKKHVGVLEQAGLVATEKVGRVRTCRLGPRRLEEETAWIEGYRQLWASRFDELDKVVEELKRKEKVDGRKKRE
jgi:DNA-binding transcriptional ArsR family regulator